MGLISINELFIIYAQLGGSFGEKLIDVVKRTLSPALPRRHARRSRESGGFDPPMKRMESEQAAFWIPAFGAYDDGAWGGYLAPFTRIDRGFRRSHTPQ